jgi:hypothetical protein
VHCFLDLFLCSLFCVVHCFLVLFLCYLFCVVHCFLLFLFLCSAHSVIGQLAVDSVMRMELIIIIMLLIRLGNYSFLVHV